VLTGHWFGGCQHRLERSNLTRVHAMESGAPSQEDKPPHAWLTELFPNLAEPLLSEAATALRPLRAAVGQLIARAGDPADDLYIITRGDVAIRREYATGTTPLALLGPGQFFGEMALLSGERRSASAYASTEVDLLLLDRATFLRIAQHPANETSPATLRQQNWDRAVRATCHALVAAHGALRSIDLVGQPASQAGPPWLLQLTDLARRTGAEYGIGVKVKLRDGRPTMHFDLSSPV
jgi:CRP-like cAMP-binding protein